MPPLARACGVHTRVEPAEKHAADRVQVVLHLILRCAPRAGYLERHGEHAVVRILEFGDGFTNVDDSHGEQVFETACRLADLAGQTLSVVHRINNQVQPLHVDTTLATQERLLRQLIRERKRLGSHSLALTRRRDTAALGLHGI